jgi:hypothetical protein
MSQITASAIAGRFNPNQLAGVTLLYLLIGKHLGNRRQVRFSDLTAAGLTDCLEARRIFKAIESIREEEEQAGQAMFSRAESRAAFRSRLADHLLELSEEIADSGAAIETRQALQGALAHLTIAAASLSDSDAVSAGWIYARLEEVRRAAFAL